MSFSYSTDIVIFGGGVGGLWLLNRLRNEGYHAVLLESQALGSGQTIASQGIIHGGLKYALSGVLTGAANVTARMPDRWRACLAGTGDVDLRGVRLLSPQYYMWSEASLRSKLKSFFGSKSLQGRVDPVARDQYPELFRRAGTKGSLYRLPDFVIDTPSLLSTLAGNVPGQLFQIAGDPIRFSRDAQNKVASVTVQSPSGEATIQAGRFVFTAGAGNEALIRQAGIESAQTQRRPLKMVYLKKSGLPDAYVHCVGDSFSLTPKLTITSHPAADGTQVWYLGGELAESGVGLDQSEQIDRARQLLESQFPDIDTNGEWGVLDIDRAEANINNNYRPDDAFFFDEDHVLVAWPTKLTLAPSLADKIVEHLSAEAFVATAESDASLADAGFTPPPIANAYWDPT